MSVTPEQIRRIRRALVEFGYPGLTEAEVTEAAEAAMRGEEPTDVIGMFVRGFLSDAGLL